MSLKPGDKKSNHIKDWCDSKPGVIPGDFNSNQEQTNKQKNIYKFDEQQDWVNNLINSIIYFYWYDKKL
jgi:hypothetical protein